MTVLCVCCRYGKKASSIMSDLIILCVVGGIVYAIYRTCIVGGPQTDDGHPHQGYDNRGAGSQPPPPGFRQDYMPGGGKMLST